MNQPTFDLPDLPGPPARRYVSGWFIFALVIGLLIIVQLIGYLKPSSERRVESELLEMDRQLEMTVDLSTLMPGSTSDDKPAELHPQIKSALEKNLKELREPAKKEPAAAMFALVYDDLLGKGPDPKHVDLLKKSEGKRHQAAAKIYTREQLTEQDAKQFGEPFTGATFLDKIVKLEIEQRQGKNVNFTSLADKSKGPIMMVVATGFILLIFAGIGLLGVYAGLRSKGQLAPVGHPSGELTAAQADANAGRTALMLVALFGSNILLAGFAPALGIKEERVISVLAFALSFVVALLLLKAKFNETTMSAKSVGLSFKNFGKNVAWGIGAWVACLPILLASALIGYALFFWMPAPSHPITEELRSSQSGIQVLLLFLAAAVGAPLYEELVFRGTLLPALTRLKNNRWFGIILCGLLFAAIHPTGVPAWFALASIGSMAAFVTYQTGSLVPAIVMHAVHNGILVMATRLMF